ncbi:GNAT family N-acetyltransferase [Rhizobium sp. NPDC090279]|uniref:GNAT family N-acetyltransferase n=1 Tax=Rhizobium sp. NPDC090279 TaxID=3364499 RepID=UPI00383AAD20
MIIRRATEGDAARGCWLLRRSFAELCGRDHLWDPVRIQEGIAEKTPENWHQWVNSTSADLYVAETAAALVGVGLLTHRGEIILNHVCPDHRFRGISKGLLAHMECEGRMLGLVFCYVGSTRTAMSFYQSAGYMPVPDSITSERMRKRIC